MSGSASGTNRLVSFILALIFIPLSGLTWGIDLFSAGKRPDVSRVNIAGIGAYFRSQGITCDGEHFYFSSKTTLICTETDARTSVKVNYSAIPDVLADTCGIKHIGGISYYDGKIYAGMEDSKVWDYPVVGVFNADTLELEEYFILDREKITRGLPWVAVDPGTGYLYCMDHSKNPTVILSFDTSDGMKPVGETELSGSVPSVQGAEFRDGVLYAATNDETQAIYRVNVLTGETEKIIERNLTPGSEGEGMTFIEKEGGVYIAAVDMGPLFVNAFVREYSF